MGFGLGGLGGCCCDTDPCINSNCTSGTFPSRVQIEMTGWVNGTCTNCTNWNTLLTTSLNIIAPSGGTCCSWLENALVLCFSVQQYSLLICTGSPAGKNRYIFGFDQFRWEKDGVDPDCTQEVELTIADRTDTGAHCNSDGVVITLTPLYT